MTTEEFRAIRLQLGLSQRALALRLGYAHTMRITEIEGGRMAITPQVERLMIAYRDGYVPHADTLSRKAPQAVS